MKVIRTNYQFLLKVIIFFSELSWQWFQVGSSKYLLILADVKAGCGLDVIREGRVA